MFDYDFLLYHYFNDLLDKITNIHIEYIDKIILEQKINKITNQNSQEVINDLVLKLSLYSSDINLSYLSLQMVKYVNNNNLKYQILKNIFKKFCWNDFNYIIAYNLYIASILSFGNPDYYYDLSKREIRKILLFTSRVYFSKLKKSTSIHYSNFLQVMYYRFINIIDSLKEKKIFMNIFCRTIFNNLTLPFDDQTQNYLDDFKIIIKNWSLINDKNKKIIKKNIKQWINLIKEKQYIKINPYDEVIQVIIENI